MKDTPPTLTSGSRPSAAVLAGMQLRGRGIGLKPMPANLAGSLIRKAFISKRPWFKISALASGIALAFRTRTPLFLIS